VDLVDEEDVAARERGEDTGQIALAFEGRAGGDAGLGPHLVGDDVGQGGLAETGRAGEEDVIEGASALLGGGHVDGEVVGDLALAHELGEGARPQGELVLIDAGAALGRNETTARLGLALPFVVHLAGHLLSLTFSGAQPGLA
jgi:hypothetical protein